jgi:hypothetical protein
MRPSIRKAIDPENASSLPKTLASCATGGFATAYLYMTLGLYFGFHQVLLDFQDSASTYTILCTVLIVPSRVLLEKDEAA